MSLAQQVLPIVAVVASNYFAVGTPGVFAVEQAVFIGIGQGFSATRVLAPGAELRVERFHRRFQRANVTG